MCIRDREIESEFDPSLSLAFVQGVGVHDARGVVEPGAAHHRTVHVSGENKKKRGKKNNINTRIEEFENRHPFVSTRLIESVSTICQDRKWVPKDFSGPGKLLKMRN